MAARTQADGLRRQLASLTAAQNAVSTRLTKVESTVNGLPNPTAVAKKAAPSVFTVETDAGTGSGFVVSADPDSSELVTNFHVIADPYLSGGRTVQVKRGNLTHSGRITRISRADDLALGYAANDDHSAALASLDAVESSCDTAYDLL